MRRIERWAPVLFFAILAGLEIAHGVTRLESLRNARTQDIVEGAAQAQNDLAAELRAKGAEGKRHAAYVARLPDAAALARGSSTTTARDDLRGQMLAQLASFPEIDRVRVIAESGREVFRCERMGGGVAVIPEALLSPEPDLAARELAERLEPGAVAISDLFLDRERVEVPESERKVVHYVAKPFGSYFPGFVVLTVYASPMLDEVRRFAPIQGSTSVLVARSGEYVAAPDRSKEIGGATPSSLVRDRPEAAAILGGATRAEQSGVFFLAASTGELPWLIVTEIPEAALTGATRKMSYEYALVIAAMSATLLLILFGAIVFHRLALRAFRLREAEAALRQLKQKRDLELRLSTADRLSSLGLLTAGVAHEINNPLEGIGNYLALLERDDSAPEKRKRHLDAVRHGFERIREVVRNLLGFARPVRGPGSADMRRVVAHALELARFAKDCREVTFEVLGGDDPIMVNGDAGGLEQVILNLFLNAGHAMNGRGKIAVTLGRSAREVEARVDDDGPGIPPENLDRIFDPFFTTGEGSGLGLSVSYGIAQAHGGTLAAENRPGRGARFTLRLPAPNLEAAGRKQD